MVKTRNRPTFRPRLEALEDRLCPASYLWSPVDPGPQAWHLGQHWVNEADQSTGTAPGLNDSARFNTNSQHCVLMNSVVVKGLTTEIPFSGGLILNGKTLKVTGQGSFFDLQGGIIAATTPAGGWDFGSKLELFTSGVIDTRTVIRMHDNVVPGMPGAPASGVVEFGSGTTIVEDNFDRQMVAQARFSVGTTAGAGTLMLRIDADKEFHLGLVGDLDVTSSGTLMLSGGGRVSATLGEERNANFMSVMGHVIKTGAGVFNVDLMTSVQLPSATVTVLAGELGLGTAVPDGTTESFRINTGVVTIRAGAVLNTPYGFRMAGGVLKAENHTGEALADAVLLSPAGVKVSGGTVALSANLSGGVPSQTHTQLKVLGNLEVSDTFGPTTILLHATAVGAFGGVTSFGTDVLYVSGSITFSGSNTFRYSAVREGVDDFWPAVADVIDCGGVVGDFTSAYLGEEGQEALTDWFTPSLVVGGGRAKSRLTGKDL